MASRSKSGGSVAPKERINISYRPATGTAKEGVELPFKVLVLGDFTQIPSSLSVEERRLISINSTNFDEVVSEFDISVGFEVENKFKTDGSTLNINFKIDKMSDFEPDNIRVK
jgi:type VI secretion system protein ImpB